jgi:hypothetical protein
LRASGVRERQRGSAGGELQDIPARNSHGFLPWNARAWRLDDQVTAISVARGEALGTRAFHCHCGRVYRAPQPVLFSATDDQ